MSSMIDPVRYTLEDDGVFPNNKRWDICYGTAAERPQADRTIAGLALAQADPV